MPPISAIVGGSLFAYAPGGSEFAFETNEFAVQFSLGLTDGIHLPLAPHMGTSINLSATLAGRKADPTRVAKVGSEWRVPSARGCTTKPFRPMAAGGRRGDADDAAANDRSHWVLFASDRENSTDLMLTFTLARPGLGAHSRLPA